MVVQADPPLFVAPVKPLQAHDVLTLLLEPSVVGASVLITLILGGGVELVERYAKLFAGPPLYVGVFCCCGTVVTVVVVVMVPSWQLGQPKYPSAHCSHDAPL